MSKKKKITGTCEMSVSIDTDNSGCPFITLCRAPARFYKDVGWFGTYICDEHLAKRANGM